MERRTAQQRAALRLIFQNPLSSLNPRVTVRSALMRPLQKFAGLSKREAQVRAVELLAAVGLDPSNLDRLPSELSGGQLQRIALARALSANPAVVVADEAVSALDVSVQAQVLNLLRDVQEEHGTSYIFITHDLGVVRYISDRIIVLYAGHMVESGPADAIVNAPYHPYTEALLSAVPLIDVEEPPTRIRLEGTVPSLRSAFAGCPFASRCPRKIGPICEDTPPPTLASPAADGHTILCHIPWSELEKLQRPSATT